MQFLNFVFTICGQKTNCKFGILLNLSNTKYLILLSFLIFTFVHKSTIYTKRKYKKLIQIKMNIGYIKTHIDRIFFLCSSSIKTH